MFDDGLVKMKIFSVKEWTNPTSRKQLQRLLGFANFSRRLIGDFNLIAAPLTFLKKESFSWTQEGDQAFSHLRKIFFNAFIPLPTTNFTHLHSFRSTFLFTIILPSKK